MDAQNRRQLVKLVLDVSCATQLLRTQTARLENEANAPRFELSSAPMIAAMCSGEILISRACLMCCSSRSMT